MSSIYISNILYFLILLILTSSLFIMLTSDNYFRKLIGLSIMQSSVLIFYLIIGKVNGGIVPIERNIVDAPFQNVTQMSLQGGETSLLKRSNDKLVVNEKVLLKYSSPVPQVLMLTAIVVGFATLSLGLSLIYLIFKQFNSLTPVDY